MKYKRSEIDGCRKYSRILARLVRKCVSGNLYAVLRFNQEWTVTKLDGGQGCDLVSGATQLCVRMDVHFSWHVAVVTCLHVI